MAVPLNRVLDGAVEFIEKNIMPGMNDWQEVVARMAIGRVYDNREAVQNFLVNTGYIRTFALIDDAGNVDIDRLASDLKRQVEMKGKIEVNLKLFGKLKFDANDVDQLYRLIIKE